MHPFTFRGKVLAEGTKSAPIVFRASKADTPWGAITIQGKAASNSLFRFVHINDGSVATENLIHYTAPLNFHDVNGFTVANCIIGKNHTGDDGMHVAYAKGTISDCIFEDARSDALDIDIGEVEISRSIFAIRGTMAWTS